MSFRLQRQRGTLPSRVRPWVGFFLLMSAGAWLWLDQSQVSPPPTSSPAPQASPTMTASLQPHPDEVALAPMPIASLPERPAMAAAISEKPITNTTGTPYTFLFEG